ncbi:MAG: zinc ribbon domain-containing protein [Clostridiaceae bacterium]
MNILIIFTFLILIILLIVAIGVFVYKDAVLHNMDPVIWTLIAVLVPNLVGFIIYLVVRSSKKDTLKCPSCNNPVKSDYVKCPVCGSNLKATCPICGKAVNSDWKNCPYCSAELSNNKGENESFAYNDTNISDNYDKKSNKSLKLIIGVIIAIVLLLSVTIIISFTAFNYNNDSNVSIMSSSTDIPMKINEFIGNGSKEILKSKYSYWNGSKEKNISLSKGDTLEISYSSKVKNGNLEINIYDDNKNLITSLPTNEEDKYCYVAEKDEKIQISIIGDKTKGEYSIEASIVE